MAAGTVALLLWIALQFFLPTNDLAILAKEKCLSCHAIPSGMVAAHSPALIGCTSCHLGAAMAVDKQAAHTGMLKRPGGDLAAGIAGCISCHAERSTQVLTSPMTRAGGIAAVNRFAFGETSHTDNGALLSLHEVTMSATSPADRHLGFLCSTCHLGRPKLFTGPGHPETNRGGACLACHLSYAAGQTGVSEKYHPAARLPVPDDRCFGCHARSGRISLSYEGWAEVDEIPAGAGTRTLADGRILMQVPPDVHKTAGMSCTDCHGAAELMGDGRLYDHLEQAVGIRCTHCHTEADQPLSSLPVTTLTPADQRLIKRWWGASATGGTIVADMLNRPITNLRQQVSGAPRVRSRNSEKIYAPKPCSRKNRIAAHSTLSCQSCHTAAAPSCYGCHTEREGDQWIESSGGLMFKPPVLGILHRDGKRTVDSFVPGMIMTLDKGDGHIVSRRLFAPLHAHNTTKTSRGCADCHWNSTALGFGSGSLDASQDSWTFNADWELLQDGLPSDAWIGFLTYPDHRSTSTRTPARPFNQTEQYKILQVGACLQCHQAGAPLFRSYQDALQQRQPSCTNIAD